jgi:simple sugar transport system permease protein
MIKVFKALFIIILMVVASPVVRVFASKALDRVKNWRLSVSQLAGNDQKDSVISTTNLTRKKGE